ncbi:MAG: glycosyltransferase [Candidatus Eisenbacteria bacterium]
MRTKPGDGASKAHGTEKDSRHRRCRVTFLSSTLGTGGAERMVREFALRLDRSRFEPSVICLRTPGRMGEEIASGGLNVLNGIMHSRYDPAALFRLRRALRESRTDVLFCLDQQNAVVLGSLASLGLVRRVFVAVHSTRQWGGKRSLSAPMRWSLRFVDRVIAVGRNQANYLRDEEGVRGEKIALIPNGIDLDEFRDAPAREDVRAALGVPAQSPVAGIVASLRPEKNHELFLEAAAMARREVPDSRFLIVGGGKRQTYLEQIARSLGIAEQVIFTGERRDGRRFVQALDVAVLCSHPVVETLPVFLLEAMALRKPVVATRVGDVASLVEDGVNGYLVQPGSAHDLAGAIVRLLKNEDLRTGMGRRGHEKVIKEFQLSRSVRMLEELVDSRMGGS